MGDFPRWDRILVMVWVPPSPHPSSLSALSPLSFSPNMVRNTVKLIGPGASFIISSISSFFTFRRPGGEQRWVNRVCPAADACRAPGSGLCAMGHHGTLPLEGFPLPRGAVQPCEKTPPTRRQKWGWEGWASVALVSVKHRQRGSCQVTPRGTHPLTEVGLGREAFSRTAAPVRCWAVG